MNISLTVEQKQKVFEPMFKYFETEEILEYFKEVVTKSFLVFLFFKILPLLSSGKYVYHLPLLPHHILYE